ncbi:unnamed protein product [Boreogadus saida]
MIGREQLAMSIWHLGSLGAGRSPADCDRGQANYDYDQILLLRHASRCRPTTDHELQRRQLSVATCLRGREPVMAVTRTPDPTEDGQRRQTAEAEAYLRSHTAAPPTPPILSRPLMATGPQFAQSHDGLPYGPTDHA